MKNYAKYDVAGRHIRIKRDDYNWIVIQGPANLKNFEKHAEYWYFTSLESMLLRLHTLLRDLGMESISYEDVVVAIENANQQIAEIAALLTNSIEGYNREVGVA
jgi:hypothetical protein